MAYRSFGTELTFLEPLFIASASKCDDHQESSDSLPQNEESMAIDLTDLDDDSLSDEAPSIDPPRKTADNSSSVCSCKSSSLDDVEEEEEDEEEDFQLINDANPSYFLEEAEISSIPVDGESPDVDSAMSPFASILKSKKRGSSAYSSSQEDLNSSFKQQRSQPFLLPPTVVRARSNYFMPLSCINRETSIISPIVETEDGLGDGLSERLRSTNRSCSAAKRKGELLRENTEGFLFSSSSDELPPMPIAQNNSRNCALPSLADDPCCCCCPYKGSAGSKPCAGQPSYPAYWCYCCGSNPPAAKRDSCIQTTAMPCCMPRCPSFAGCIPTSQVKTKGCRPSGCEDNCWRVSNGSSSSNMNDSPELGLSSNSHCGERGMVSQCEIDIETTVSGCGFAGNGSYGAGNDDDDETSKISSYMLRLGLAAAGAVGCLRAETLSRRGG